ncbi:nuclear transport factor 2 family protein [Rhizobium ruizarguesonis]
MVSNDPLQIAACITQDRVLVTPERGPIPAQAILSAIGSGVLSYDTMTKTTHHVHLLGNVATVTGRGQNTGMFAIHRRALLARGISTLPLHAAMEEDDENP